MTFRPTPCLTILLALALAAACGGCRGSSRKHEAAGGGTSSGATTRSSGAASARPVATQPSSFIGTLRGGAVAIGGETTGWRLEGDGQTGGIDLDVSRVLGRARQLEGKRVTASGRMTSRSWPERGETQVLVVDRVEAAPPPAGSTRPAPDRPGTGRTR
jgi:hypothetical protein